MMLKDTQTFPCPFLNRTEQAQHKTGCVTTYKGCVIAEYACIFGMKPSPKNYKMVRIASGNQNLNPATKGGCEACANFIDDIMSGCRINV